MDFGDLIIVTKQNHIFAKLKKVFLILLLQLQQRQPIQYLVFIQCPYPFTYFEPTHSCYGLGNYTGPLNWSQAERYCEDFGGHLVSIHSETELLFLGSLVYIGHQNYWTGAFSNDGGFSWKWSDNSTWDFDPWDKGRPHLNQSACGLQWGGPITDVPCNDTYQVICKKPL